MKELDNKLSVLLDEQAANPDDGALREAIDAAGADVNLQYRLRRYRLIGESLRNELPAAIDPGFHAAVMARIDSESAPAAGAAAAAEQAPRRPVSAPGGASPVSVFGRLSGLFAARPVAGLAVAAAVAVVTVALWQPRDTGDGGPDNFAKVDDPVNTGPTVPEAVSVAAQLAPPGTRWKVANPALQQKLNAYLVNHTEYASSVQGLIPQARVAGFDDGR